MFSGAFLRARSVSPWKNREPIRQELFSVERLEQHARSLAVAQKATSKSSKGLPLAGQLAGNARVLLNAYRPIAEEVADGRAITPAAEWLIDNHWLANSS
jgi:cyclic beta-1,2-glucan synthetase